MFLFNVFLIFSFVFFSPPDASAKIYKWIDENGGVHWSDKPPAPDKKGKETTTLKSIEDKDYGNLTQPSEINDKIDALQKTLKARQAEAEKLRALIPSPAQIKANKKEMRRRRKASPDRGPLVVRYESLHMNLNKGISEKKRRLRALEYKIERLEREI